MKNTYKNKQKISSYYLDSNKKLSLAACLGLVQDVTNDHSEKLGVDRWSLLKTSNAFWVITKIKLDIVEFPKLDDVVTLETWTLDNSAVKFERDCRISNGKKPLINVKTEWVSLDETTRKLRPAKTLKFPFNMKNRTDRAVEEKFSNITYKPLEEDFCYSRIIRSTDIDVNNHVNNCYYNRFVLDCFSTQFLTDNTLCKYEIHFVNESTEGQELKFYLSNQDDKYFVVATMQDKIIIKAMLQFK